MRSKLNFTKDPDAILDYMIDWTRWLNGDTITSSNWTVSTGLIKGSTSKTSLTATVWLSGGTAGQSYTVTNRITTTCGRTEDRSFTVFVEQR